MDCLSLSYEIMTSNIGEMNNTTKHHFKNVLFPNEFF